MTTQDIKPGYKQSPIGPIPNERKISTLGKIFGDIKIGGTPARNRSDYFGGGIPWVSIKDMGRGKYISKTNETLSVEGVKNSNVKLIRKGALLFSFKLSVGKMCFAGIDLYTNEAIAAFEPNEGMKLEYLYDILPFATKQVKTVNNFGAPLLNKEGIKKLIIPLPPLPEQEAIANILGKVDENIEKTQNMIEKLELRNKGLEQKLLTGKIRLKGFSGEFKKLSADKIFKSVSIKNLPDEELLSATQEQGIIPRSMLEGRVTMPTSEAKSYKLVVPGNFVISLRSFQGGLEYSKYRGIVSPAYTVLDHILPICDDYYKYYFKSYDFIGHLSIAVVGIRDGKQISFDDFCTLNLPYPEIEEQKAIANVLNKANEQLDKYEQKLEKLQELKKGLMQQLLTGKVRVKEFRN